MHRHFSQHANVSKMLFESRPKHVLEVGALDGENTRKLQLIQPELGFKLTVISDDVDPKNGESHTAYIQGVSYKVIQCLEDASIDFCIIDTDHNYWTLWAELLALDAKLVTGALVVIHDVTTFYYNTGMADFYADGTAYPADDIKQVAPRGSLGVAVLDFLSKYPFNYHLVRWVPEENGCAVIKKNPPEVELSLLQPGAGKTGKRKGVARV